MLLLRGIERVTWLTLYLDLRDSGVAPGVDSEIIDPFSWVVYLRSARVPRAR